MVRSHAAPDIYLEFSHRTAPRSRNLVKFDCKRTSYRRCRAFPRVCIFCYPTARNRQALRGVAALRFNERNLRDLLVDVVPQAAMEASTRFTSRDPVMPKADRIAA
jgi:hypothetical protein